FGDKQAIAAEAQRIVRIEAQHVFIADDRKHARIREHAARDERFSPIQIVCNGPQPHGLALAVASADFQAAERRATQSSAEITQGPMILAPSETTTPGPIKASASMWAVAGTRALEATQPPTL